YMLDIGEFQDIRNLAKEENPAPAGPVKFTDVRQSSGIRFMHGAQGPAEASIKNLVSAMGSGAAFCDYDGDGFLDLYLANCSSDPAKSRGVLYHNDGKAHFEDVTEKAGHSSSLLGMGAYWGDLNNDGRPDLFLTNYGVNKLY